MSEANVRRHGLEPMIASVPVADEAGVSIVVQSDMGHINLRGDATDTGFVDAAETALGQPLPVEPNTATSGTRRIYWLGPDEWLVVTAAAGTAALTSALEAGLIGQHAAVNDLSGGNVALRLEGPRARDVLAKGCTLDLHPAELSVGQCAQSGLAKASILLGVLDETPAFEIVVRRSFADYMLRWLLHSARMYGVNASTS